MWNRRGFITRALCLASASIEIFDVNDLGPLELQSLARAIVYRYELE